MTHETLQELLVDQVRDIYDAEKQLVKALPKLAKASTSDDLQTAIRDHLEETKGQVARLEQVFELLGETAKGKACKAMKGLIEEGSEATEEDEEIRDLCIIAGAQRVEHYEISAYGTARTLAEQLGLDEVAGLLQETEDEEVEADSKLSGIALALYEAADTGDEDDMDDEEMEESDEEETAAVAGRSTSSSKSRKK